MTRVHSSLATSALAAIHHRLSARLPHIHCLALHVGDVPAAGQEDLVSAHLGRARRTPWAEVTAAHAFISVAVPNTHRAVIFLSERDNQPKYRLLEITKGALAPAWTLAPVCDRLHEVELLHEWGHVATATSSISQMMWEYQANRFVVQDAALMGDKELGGLCVKSAALQAFLGGATPHYAHAFSLLRSEQASEMALAHEADAWLDLRYRCFRHALTRGDVPSYLGDGLPNFQKVQAHFKALARLDRPATSAEMAPLHFLEQAGHGTLPALAELLAQKKAFSNPLCASLGRLVLRSVETLAPSCVPRLQAPQTVGALSWPQLSALS